MMERKLRAVIPEQFPVCIQVSGKRQYLSGRDSITLPLGESDTAALTQDGPMTGLGKTLAAIGIFLTAPLQLAYLFCCGQERWDSLIPFRLSAVLGFLGDSMCCISVKRDLTQFQPPRLTLSGAALAECHWEPSPWVFEDACFIDSCRIIGGMLWLLGLMGYLFNLGLAQKNLPGMLVTGAVFLGTIVTAAILLRQMQRTCSKKLETLKQWSG